MGEHDKLIATLHPLERKVLPFLQDGITVQQLEEKTGMQEVEVIRALQWLSNKHVLTLAKTSSYTLTLGDNGQLYVTQGLPERRFLDALVDGSLSLAALREKAQLNVDEINVCVGKLKRVGAIVFGQQVSLTQKGRTLLEDTFPEEVFLASLPRPLSSLTPAEEQLYEELRERRDFLVVKEEKQFTVTLTDLGKTVTSVELPKDFIDAVTPDLLRTGTWKTGTFRRYDVEINVPKITGGRIHPLEFLIRNIRKIFLSMGFQEMEGSWVESAFWCMDSMWIPQDHPSRDIQDTFYLPYQGTIPEALAKKVAVVHETGGKTGSKGYKYTWDPELAKQLLLRTHTTATTFRYFGEKNIAPPAKYFCVGRIFRNEALDATHLHEFHQVEGFVMEEGLTLRDLMGYVKEFYAQLGVTKIKFKPTYNPYTEPSMECLGYSDTLGRWIELINSGIFRPEALEPFGITVPVIAWGFGVERLAMLLYGQEDIRNVFGTYVDLDIIRHYPLPR